MSETGNLGLCVAGKLDKLAAVCTLTPEALNKANELGKGQRIRAVGRLQGGSILGTVFLFDSTFTEAGPNPSIRISATDLAAEFAKDEGDAAATKYAGKELFVQGVVAGIEQAGEGIFVNRIVLFESGAKEPVRCTRTRESDFEKIKKGDKVILKGDFQGETIALKKHPTITETRLVKKD